MVKTLETTATQPFNSSPFIRLPGQLVGRIASFLSAADAVRLSRTTPYLSHNSMRAADQYDNVDFLKKYRIPQSLEWIQNKLSPNGNPLLSWMRANPLKTEHLYSQSFYSPNPAYTQLLSGHARLPGPVYSTRGSNPLECVMAAAFCFNGQIVSGGHDSDIRLWDKNKAGEWQSNILNGHTRPVERISVNIDGSRLLSASWGTDILLHTRSANGHWSHETLDHTYDMNGRYHTSPSTWFSPSGQFAITEPTTPSPLHIHALDNPAPFALGNSKDYRQVLFSKDDKQAFLVPAQNPLNGIIHHWYQETDLNWSYSLLQAHLSPVRKLVLSPNEQFLLTISIHDSIVWKINDTNAWVPTLQLPYPLNHFQFHPKDQSLLAHVDSKKGTRLWHLDTHCESRGTHQNKKGKIDSTQSPPRPNPIQLGGFPQSIYDLGFSPDGESLYISGSNPNANGFVSYSLKVYIKNHLDDWVLSNSLNLNHLYGSSLTISLDRRHVLLKGCELTKSTHTNSMVVGRPQLWLYNQGLENMSGNGELLRGEDWMAETATFNSDGSEILIVDNKKQLRVMHKIQDND